MKRAHRHRIVEANLSEHIAQENAAYRQIIRDSSFYTLTEADVGRWIIHCFGKKWMVSSFIGRILRWDVGKRVYRRGDILQVENDEQRDERLRRAS